MAENNSDEPRTLEIRKYQNRRYYDGTRSQQQIHKLIIEGYHIRVLDAKTNEDITPKVLTQILLEYEPVKLDLFSNELLIRAIRVNDRLLKDFVDAYFRQAFEAFCLSQKAGRTDAPSSPSLDLRPARGRVVGGQPSLPPLASSNICRGLLPRPSRAPARGCAARQPVPGCFPSNPPAP